MRIHSFAIALLLASAAAPAADVKSSEIDATAAFSRLKGLVGEWEATTGMGKVQLSYELIGGGTALVERERGEKMPEMMTVYHMDGKRLLLTHYCMAGNQPRMELKSYNPEAGELQFRLLDITNLASPAAGHMRNVTLHLADARHVASEWEFYEDGQVKMTESAQYTRVK